LIPSGDILEMQDSSRLIPSGDILEMQDKIIAEVQPVSPQGNIDEIVPWNTIAREIPEGNIKSESL
jgi:hypothetical protein